MRLLDAEEIKEVLVRHCNWREEQLFPDFPEARTTYTVENVYSMVYGRDIKLVDDSAKAQHQLDLKEFIEWGEEECKEHPYTSRAKGEMYNRKRHRCPECWQSLKQLVEV